MTLAMYRNENISFEVVSARHALESSRLSTEWENLFNTNRHPYALFASPSWVNHLAETSISPLSVVFGRSEKGHIVGAVPIRHREYSLIFSIGNRVLLRPKLKAAEILGSIPTLPQIPKYYQALIGEVFAQWSDCDCIYLDTLPVDTYFWNLLTDREGLPRSFYLHVADGPRPWHLVLLAPTFEDYLKSMSPKARANLRREVRQLNEVAHGELKLCCITEVGQVTEFLERAANVSQHSWQNRVLGERVRRDTSSQKSYEDIALRGILRSYLLQIGDTPCAFAIGYQFAHTYYYVEVGFDQQLSKYSPGKVLLSLILEDLHTKNRPNTLNFGAGDGIYKRRFGNCQRSDAACLILRRQVRNVLLTKSHSLFNSAVTMTKKLTRHKVEK
jgi:CelD/BcsL family acetyltransferase involved in cellulose biosynthesis